MRKVHKQTDKCVKMFIRIQLNWPIFICLRFNFKLHKCYIDVHFYKNSYYTFLCISYVNRREIVNSTLASIINNNYTRAHDKMFHHKN